MDKESILNSIFDSDPLGLLEVKVKNPLITANDRLVASFEEINNFYEEHNQKPQKSTNMHERKLFSRLDGIQKDEYKIKILKEYDRFGLLEQIQTLKVTSIDDIFANDPLNLLSSNDEDIFTLKNVPKSITMPNYIASRKPCEEFKKYEDLFKECHNNLKVGKRKLIKFQDEQQIKVGYYFVLKGVLLYVASVGEKFKKDNKTNARLKLIFENGTESDMLLRSLSAELYKNGKRVSDYDESRKEGLYKDPITKDDKQNGYIYILKSLSNDDRVLTKKNLYKIGFSTTTVEERIKNSSQDPTYLMADVQIVASYKVYNVNPHKLEQLIHKFFSNSCLDIDIVDKKEDIHKPREWFIAPLEVIEEAIELIINGEIINYKYDEIDELIVDKGKV